MKEYKIIKLNQLHPAEIREIRPNIVEKIKESIQTNGYYDARVLAVIKNNEGYLVVDGNHRLKAAQELDLKDLPCVIYTTKNIYKLAIKGNEVENTYAPMDLFDWLRIIEKLQNEGLTQQEIGDKIGWSREKVRDYYKIIKSIGAEILDFCKNNQFDRAPKNVANAPFDFTEGWFRDSGLYDLGEEYQQLALEYFINEKKGKLSKKLFNDITTGYKEIQNQILLVKDKLDPSLENEDLIEAIKRGEYSTERLETVIKNINKGAKNKAIFGVDCRDELKLIEDNSIDCLITDPPWGVEFKPSRKTDNPEYDLNLKDALKLFDDVMKESDRICKENAHLYIFFPTTFYSEFKQILDKYFDVYPIPLIWYKNNHNPCDFKKRYASIYETIFFCKMGNGNKRELNNSVSPDVLSFNKVKDKKHDSEKPIDLLEYLIKNSTGENEIILDPFMGSGNTLLAAARVKRSYIGFEKDDTYESNFKKQLGDILK